MNHSNFSLSRSLGDQESRLLTSLSAAGYTIFTIEDARTFLDSDDVLARKLLHRLYRKGWVSRIERGKYLILPLAAGPLAQWAEHDYIIASSLVKPYYLAYATAFNYYGYSERLSHQIIIATTKRKQSLMYNDLNCRFVTLASHKFFGFEPIKIGDQTVQMAECEKAICDGFDHPELVGGVIEAAKGLYFGADELDWDKVASYSLRLGNQVATRRLGFWLDLLKVADEAILSRLEKSKGHNYSYLEPGGMADGQRNTRWRLIVNVPDEQLLEWREY